MASNGEQIGIIILLQVFDSTNFQALDKRMIFSGVPAENKRLIEIQILKHITGGIGYCVYCMLLLLLFISTLYNDL